MSKLKFVVVDYYATGEGRTVSVLVTRAYGTVEDREKGKTRDQLALEEMKSHIGGWFVRAAEILPEEEFLERYGHHLPEYMKKLIETSKTEPIGNLNYFSSLHLNLS